MRQVDGLLEIDEEYLSSRYSTVSKGYACQYCAALEKSPDALKKHYSVCERIPAYNSLSEALTNSGNGPAGRKALTTAEAYHKGQGIEPAQSCVSHGAIKKTVSPAVHTRSVMVRCPECGSSVDASRLSGHLQRVHSIFEEDHREPWLVFTGRVESSRRRH